MAEKRADDLRAWATSRIEECRRLEQKFGRSLAEKGPIAQTLIEAGVERRTLQAVLAMLDEAER